MRGTQARATSGTLALAALWLACASGPTLRNGVYRDRAQGWSIAAPPPEWKRVAVDGADLAFRGPSGASIAVASRCDVAVVPLDVLAGQLRQGFGAGSVLAERDVAIAGRPARLQVLALAGGGRVTTVTRAAAPCVQDFVLVAPSGADDAAAGVFEAWWASFAPASEATR